MERGTVSMRVAFVLRSVEVQPLFRDLLVALPCARGIFFTVPAFRHAVSSPLLTSQHNNDYQIIH
jgi:hypothetical protein